VSDIVFALILCDCLAMQAHVMSMQEQGAADAIASKRCLVYYYAATTAIAAMQLT
jgi:hypothetical protein